MKYRLPPVILLTVLAAFTSCTHSSSGGLPPGVPDDLPGAWKVWVQEAGQVEAGPVALFLTLSGAEIGGADLVGKIEGNSFEFSTAVVDGMTNVVGRLVTATTASGSYTTVRTSGAEVKGTFRMEKFQPTGMVSIQGTILGEDVSHEATNAVGIRKYLDPEHTFLVEVEIVTGSADLNFELDINPRNLVVGALTVGAGSNELGAAIEFSNGVRAARAEAVDGSFIVTTYDDTGFSATFTFDLDTGDTVTGSIDVDFDLEALHPFAL